MMTSLEDWNWMKIWILDWIEIAELNAKGYNSLLVDNFVDGMNMGATVEIR